MASLQDRKQVESMLLRYFFLFVCAWIACGCGEPSLIADAGETSPAHVLGVGPVGPFPIRLLQTDGGVDGGVPTITGSGTIWQQPSIALAGVPHGTSAQILMTNATPATTWNTESGDCTLSATGVQTCTQLQGGEITAGASTGTLTCNGGATACGIAQTIQANGSNPVNMTLSPQPPGAACTSSATCTPGSVVLNLPTPGSTGSPTESYLQLNRAGTPFGYIGGYPGAPTTDWGIWLGGAAPTGTSYVFLGDSTGNGFVNAPSAGAALIMRVGNTQTNGDGQAVITLSGIQLFRNQSSVDFGGGTGVLGIGVAAGAPTAATTTAGDVVVWGGTGPDATHFGNHSDTSPYSSAIGWDSTISGDALWLDPQSTGTFVDGTIAIGVSSAGNTYVNTGTTGFLTVGGTSAKQLLWNGSGIELFAGTADFGGGAGVLGVTGAGTVPTTNPGSGNAILFSTNTTGVNSNAGFNFRGHSGTITTIPP